MSQAGQREPAGCCQIPGTPEWKVPVPGLSVRVHVGFARHEKAYIRCTPAAAHQRFKLEWVRHACEQQECTCR